MNKSGRRPPAWDSSAHLDRDIQSKIGEQLRHMHDEIVKEGVPARFRALLGQLGESDGADESGTK